MKIENIISLFIDYFRDVKRYSPNTVRAYKTDLEDFNQYCRSFDKNELTSISDRFLLSYLRQTNEKKVSKLTLIRKLSALRSLFKFAYNEGIIKHNPAISLRNPKAPTKLPEIAAQNDILKIYELSLQNDRTPYLVMVIFEILYGSSLRVSELCNLTLKDLDLEKNNLRVFGKGSKVRIVPVGKKSRSIIEKYLSIYPPKNSNSPLIRTRKDIKLYPDYVYRIVKKYLKEATDLKKCSPHILRHSSATHMLDRGADLMAVKEILGHKNLRTTQVYTHVSIERLKSAYKKSHPKS